MQKSCILLLILLIIRGFSLFSQDNSLLQAEDADKIPVLDSSYKRALAEALYIQLKADSLARTVRDKKILARETPDLTVKKELTDEIFKMEKEAEMFQVQADRLFDKAREIRNALSGHEIIDKEVLIYSRTVNGIKVFQYNISPDTGSISVSVVSVNSEKSGEADAATVAGSETKNDSEVQKTDDFAMRQQSPYNVANPFPEGLTIIPGLIYRIQLGVYSSPVPYEAFSGISPVCFEKTGEEETFKYFAGVFFSLAGVTAALELIRSAGFPDAFIVAFLDGNPISTERAREIEYAPYKL
ncbi:MAG: hypothetical protein JXA61_04125 [Bacteroidales bacterium]|nr:hypothetical protein [Bacteroidales bacterium]